MMQKPNPMDYPMTIDGDLQYQTDLEVWRSQQREKLKRSDEQTAREQFAPPPDTIQVSRAEYEALRAEVASLKEELGKQKAYSQDMVATYHSLTQQLAAANGRVEDCKAWLERLLGDLKYKQTNGYGPKTEGYAYAEVPDWAIRQKLAALSNLNEDRDKSDV